ncbi:MAG: hypothetical protein L6R42_006003 [Xanthoria sp. 1 TBL-2021]|nr:MAG: hypothetical protein L6R42_006003 [Xanthoria sp. 1 TBL-2021]
MAASNGHDRLTDLTPELRRMIAEFTIRDDLKNLRVVSKFWNDVATPILFSALSFRMHTTPAEWSERVKFDKGAFVKTFYVKTIEFEDLDYSEYEERICGEDSCPVDEIQHLQQRFATYKKLREDHVEMMAERHCLAYLTVLLDSMTNLHKVKLTGDFRAVYLRHLRILSDCESASSTSMFIDPADLTVEPRSGLADPGKTHLQILLSALAVAKSPCSELQVKGFGENDELRYKAWDIAATHDNLAVFSRLTKLDLVFDGDTYHDLDVPTTTTTDAEYISCVARTLSYAINLLHLTLVLDNSDRRDYDDLGVVLHGCRLPKLLTCELVYNTASYETLANFIDGSPNLSRLTIWHRESANRTLDCIRDGLRKKKPQLTLDINWE